jgi:hypothetical protein
LRQEEVKAASTLLGQSDTAIESRARQEITTTFRGDGSYERVRTYFPSGRKEWKGAATAEAPQTSDLSPNERGDQRKWLPNRWQHLMPMETRLKILQSLRHRQPMRHHLLQRPTQTITPVEDAQDGQEPLFATCALAVTGSTDATAPMYDILIGNDVAEARQYGILGIKQRTQSRA